MTTMTIAPGRTATPPGALRHTLAQRYNVAQRHAVALLRVVAVRYPAVGRLVRFSAVGLVSTVATLVLYAGLRTAVDAQTANVVATIVVGLANTVVNQRFTFDAGGDSGWRHLASSLALLGLGLALNAVALAGLAAFAPDASRVAELTAVVVASLAGGLVRFLVLNGLGAAHPAGPVAGATPISRPR
jgi:putative flippase GtrA